MKNLLRVEELLMFFLAFYLFVQLNVAWWLFFLLLLAPDLSMLGYLLGPRIGAITYNIAHHKGLAIALFIAGGVLGLVVLQAIGLIAFAHSSIDRVLGYGLKYPDSFQHTHLGYIGRAE